MVASSALIRAAPVRGDLDALAVALAAALICVFFAMMAIVVPDSDASTIRTLGKLWNC